MLKQTILTLALASMIFTLGCANQTPPPAPTIPKIDWTTPQAPEYEKVTWSHESLPPESSPNKAGRHCLDGDNAKALLINEERKNAYIEKLILQLNAMKTTFDLLAEKTNPANQQRP